MIKGQQVDFQYRGVFHGRFCSWWQGDTDEITQKWLLYRYIYIYIYIYTLPKFNSSPLKNDVWKTSLSFWDGLFSGATLVSGRVYRSISGSSGCHLWCFLRASWTWSMRIRRRVATLNGRSDGENLGPPFSYRKKHLEMVFLAFDV